MFERILVPLDGSETAEAALAYVALLPSERVRLLAVESTGPISPRCARPRETAGAIWRRSPHPCGSKAGMSIRSLPSATQPSRFSRSRPRLTSW